MTYAFSFAQIEMKSGGKVVVGNYKIQNVPNPFTRETKIGYYLTEQSNDAHIYVYNMNGQQIDHFSLTQKGKNTITIGKNKLPAGMYYYTLIVDGQEISTKKMILTQ